MDGLTAACVTSLRRCLPDAEIILSTWKGTPAGPLAELPLDRLLLNDDPGGDPYCGNLNRQIVSSAGGLALATRPYAMKFRADMAMTHTGFLDLFRTFPARLPDHRYFRERLVVVNAWHPAIIGRLCPSDFVYFGLREDVTALWDVPLFPGPERMALLPEAYREDLRFFMFEQYPFLMHARKTMHLSPQCDPAEDARHYEECLRIMMNNFICAGADHLGVQFLKATLTHLNHTEQTNYNKYWFSSWLLGEWCEVYERLCGDTITPPTPVLAEEIARGKATARHKASLYRRGPPNTHNTFIASLDSVQTAARAAFQEGRYNHALNAFSLVNLTRPKDRRTIEDLAAVHQAMGNHAAARHWQNHLEQLESGAG